MNVSNMDWWYIGQDANIKSSIIHHRVPSGIDILNITVTILNTLEFRVI